MGLPSKTDGACARRRCPARPRRVPLSIARDLDKRGWLEGVKTFVFHMHLPHYAVTDEDPNDDPRAGPPAGRSVKAASVHRSGEPRVQHVLVDAARRASAPATSSLPTRRSLPRCSAATKASTLLEEPRDEVENMPKLELDDIQSGVLRPRPTPFHATYIILRIDDRAAGPRAHAPPSAASSPPAAHPREPRARHLGQRLAHLSRPQGARRAAGIARQLFAAVPTRDGGARAALSATPARAARNTGRSRSGSTDVHVVLTGVSADTAELEAALARAARAMRSSSPASRRSGVRTATCFPTRREPFGFKDGISHPAIEGSGIPGTNPHELPLKAG